MTVTVRALGSLRSRVPGSVTLENVHTVGEAIEQLDLPHTEGLAILVNGRLATWDTSLQDADVVQLVPQISGG